LIKAYKRTHNLDFTILRFFSVYGPRQRPDMAYNKIINSILKNQVVEIYGDGSQTRTNTFISDCIAATLSTINIKPKNEVINISGDSQHSLLSAVNILEKIINTKANLIFKEKRPGDQQETRGDISKAKSLLNYKPRIDLELGLKEQVNWHLKNL
jgi:nucleoside-diphosphate-sugar epimerase